MASMLFSRRWPFGRWNYSKVAGYCLREPRTMVEWSSGGAPYPAFTDPSRRLAREAIAVCKPIGLRSRLIRCRRPPCCEKAWEIGQAIALLDTALEIVNVIEDRFY
jgi:hypothetical protein